MQIKGKWHFPISGCTQAHCVLRRHWLSRGRCHGYTTTQWEARGRPRLNENNRSHFAHGGTLSLNYNTRGNGGGRFFGDRCKGRLFHRLLGALECRERRQLHRIAFPSSGDPPRGRGSCFPLTRPGGNIHARFLPRALKNRCAVSSTRTNRQGKEFRWIPLFAPGWTSASGSFSCGEGRLFHDVSRNQRSDAALVLAKVGKVFHGNHCTPAAAADDSGLNL